MGPPGWDFYTTRTRASLRFGDDPAKYEAPAEAYGTDVMTCPAWTAVRYP